MHAHQEESVTISKVLQDQLGDPKPRHVPASPGAGQPPHSPFSRYSSSQGADNAAAVDPRGVSPLGNRPAQGPGPTRTLMSPPEACESEMGLLEEARQARAEVSAEAASRGAGLGMGNLGKWCCCVD